MKDFFLNKYFIFSLVVFLVLVSLIVFAFIPGGLEGLGIKNAFPKPSSTGIEISTSIYVDFTKSLDANLAKNVFFSISPLTDASGYWSENNSRFYIKPTTGLSPQTKYNIQIKYAGKNYSWGFTTMSSDEEQAAQGLLDQATYKQTGSFFQKYPWYNSIPPENDKYFIGFDSANNEFFVDLYPLRSSPVSISDQTTLLKKEVLSELIKIGVNTSQHKISWTVVPK